MSELNDKHSVHVSSENAHYIIIITVEIILEAKYSTWEGGK